jgi:long-chain acyl-CoA synthetase
MNLAHNLEISAQFYPRHPAVREVNRETSYGKLNEMANRVASTLVKCGIIPGDLVALCAPNSAEWLAFYFGVLKTGAIAVTLSGLLKDAEVSNLVAHAKPRMVFADGARLVTLQQFKGPGGLGKIICPDGDLDFASLLKIGDPTFRTVERERRDPVAVLYTGGTTGDPKGVMLTHEGIDFSAQSTVLYERYAHLDHTLCFLPFNHVYGQIYIMGQQSLRQLPSNSCLPDGTVLWLLDNDQRAVLRCRPYIALIDILM